MRMNIENYSEEYAHNIKVSLFRFNCGTYSIFISFIYFRLELQCMQITCVGSYGTKEDKSTHTLRVNLC